jgi:hypothetical protein
MPIHNQFFLNAQLLGQVLSYLYLPSLQSVFLSNKTIYKNLQDSKVLHHYKLKHFAYLIAVEGENNQNKAEAMLMASIEDSEAISDMLVKPMRIQDAAGRDFNHISTYGYAFWSGDTFMRDMMEQYMDDDMKIKAYEECKNIQDNGIHFIFQGKINCSSHFDCQQLINAYERFRDRNFDYRAEQVLIFELLLNIGKEQAKLPVNIAQAYCDVLFLSCIRERRLTDYLGKRTTKFFDISESKEVQWGFFSQYSDLGNKYCVVQGPQLIEPISSLERENTDMIWNRQGLKELNFLIMVLEPAETLKRLQSSAQHESQFVP